MLKLKRLDNMDIVVNDFATMVDFYRDVLGLPLHPHGYEPEKGWAMFMCGDVDLVLLSVPDADRGERQRTANYNEDPAGVHSFAAEVDDIDEAIAELDRARHHVGGRYLNIYGAGEFLGGGAGGRLRRDLVPVPLVLRPGRKCDAHLRGASACRLRPRRRREVVTWPRCRA